MSRGAHFAPPANNPFFASQITSLGSGNQHVMDAIYEYESGAAARFNNDWQMLAHRRSVGRAMRLMVLSNPSLSHA